MRPTRTPSRAITCGAAMSIVALLVAFVGAIAVAPAADAATAPQANTAATAEEHQFVATVNAIRHQHGLAPLTVMSSMHVAADGWAASMASRASLAHAADISTGLPAGWQLAGENVGRGQSVQSLTTALMASASHRANILNPNYTHIGVGAVYSSDGSLWVTQRFAQY